VSPWKIEKFKGPESGNSLLNRAVVLFFSVTGISPLIILQAFIKPNATSIQSQWINIQTFAVPKGPRFLVFSVKKLLKQLFSETNSDLQVHFQTNTDMGF